MLQGVLLRSVLLGVLLRNPARSQDVEDHYRTSNDVRTRGPGADGETAGGVH